MARSGFTAARSADRCGRFESHARQSADAKFCRDEPLRSDRLDHGLRTRCIEQIPRPPPSYQPAHRQKCANKSAASLRIRSGSRAARIGTLEREIDELSHVEEALVEAAIARG